MKFTGDNTMKLIKTLKKDFSRIATPSLWNFIKFYTFPRGGEFRYIVWFRIMQKVKQNKLSKILLGIPTYIIHRHYEYKYGIHINTNIEVGEGLFIVHGDGVHLNCSKIGKNFTCYQGATLGAGKGGIPVVYDNVTVYTNAVVVGDITLNNGCSVGANAFVSVDVPENAVVAGVPAKIIKEK